MLTWVLWVIASFLKRTNNNYLQSISTIIVSLSHLKSKLSSSLSLSSHFLHSVLLALQCYDLRISDTCLLAVFAWPFIQTVLTANFAKALQGHFLFLLRLLSF